MTTTTITMRRRRGGGRDRRRWETRERHQETPRWTGTDKKNPYFQADGSDSPTEQQGLGKYSIDRREGGKVGREWSY
jgi:hypothetical protein